MGEITHFHTKTGHALTVLSNYSTKTGEAHQKKIKSMKGQELSTMYERLVSLLAEYWITNLATCLEFSVRIFEEAAMTIETVNYLKKLAAEKNTSPHVG